MNPDPSAKSPDGAPSPADATTSSQGMTSSEADVITDMEKRMKSAKSVTDKENEQRQDNLTQSKGRAQVTATTAMSIVNVALIKAVLDRGPEGNRFYMANLVLISVSLALQIIAGIMSLMIQQAHGYMSKFGGNFCEDMSDYCCLWRCVENKRSGNPEGKGLLSKSRPSTSKQRLSDAVLTPWEKPDDCDIESTILADVSDDPLCDCCPFVITSKIYAHYEINTLNKFNSWRMNFINNELNLLRTEEELQFQLKTVEDAKKKLAALTKLIKTPDADEAEIARRKALLKTQLSEASERKQNYEAILMRAKIVRKQGEILKEYVGAIKKNRLLKLATFWQQILNFIFYAIFIMNAFITGFGLSSTPIIVNNGGSAQGNATAA